MQRLPLTHCGFFVDEFWQAEEGGEIIKDKSSQTRFKQRNKGYQAVRGKCVQAAFKICDCADEE